MLENLEKEKKPIMGVRVNKLCVIENGLSSSVRSPECLR